MSDPGRVLYASFPTRRPSGGVQIQQLHVDLLRAAGIDARLWLPQVRGDAHPGAVAGRDGRPGWFPAHLPVEFGDTLPVTADDLLVLPEVPLRPGTDPAPGSRAVIFNQNHFFTFAAEPDGARAHPGWRHPPAAVWTGSVESRAVLAALHPDVPVTLIPNVVDADLFRPGARPDRSVAWLPRKRPHEAALLRRLFAADPRLAAVALREIEDEPVASVAAALGAATVFVALSHSDGFGLPVLEALTAGAVVVGYPGGGGTELFDAPGAFAVADQRPLLVLDQVAGVLARPAAELAALGRANRDWALTHYRVDRTAQALLAAVDQARSRPGSASTAVHPAGIALPAHFTRLA